MPRVVGTSLVLLILLALGGWTGYSLREEVKQGIDALPEAARRARQLVSSGAGEGLLASVREAVGKLPRTPPTERASAESQPDAGSAGAGGVAKLVRPGVESILGVAGSLVIIFFLVFFLLVSGGQVRARVIEAVGPDMEQRTRVARIIDDINAQIQRFLLVRLVTSIAVGALTWLVLAWMNVQHAALWGFLAGVFNSIPYFGPVIVSGGLLVVGLVQGGGMARAIQMSAAALAITSLEGWLLTPPLMGKAEKMSALAVFLGLLLWTWIWGAWGTLLAVPMLVMVKAVADRTPALKSIARLMAP
jgi:predicted PurR-regulated permease PerM